MVYSHMQILSFGRKELREALTPCSSSWSVTQACLAGLPGPSIHAEAKPAPGSLPSREEDDIA